MSGPGPECVNEMNITMETALSFCFLTVSPKMCQPSTLAVRRDDARNVGVRLFSLGGRLTEAIGGCSSKERTEKTPSS